MRIGVNCFLLKKEIGGLRQYFHRLFTWLLEHDRKNRYIFFYFDDNVEEMELLGSEKWKEDGIKLQENQGEISRYFNKIDLYFCPFGALWPRPIPVPAVVTIVDMQDKYYPQFFTKEALRNREIYRDTSIRIAGRVITISHFSKESIVQYHPASRNKIDVAYLAADPCFSAPPRSPEPGIRLPDNFIFYPANRWPHKNHHNLLKALLILKEQHRLKVNCLLTGFDVPNGYPLQQNISRYGLEDRVKVTGYLNREDMKHLYARAKMLCFPSLFEGFGMPLVEAMTAGCPVVCSDSSSIPEVAGAAALLFDPLDPADTAAKIALLWQDEKLRDTLIVKGKKQVENFSIQKTAEKHLETFEKARKTFKPSPYFFYFKKMYETGRSFKRNLKRGSLLRRAVRRLSRILKWRKK
ncbi:MAG: glycosyltransferase family 4 protein [Candidatus Aminicenantes bacterium]|nr:glycosyltransferase family 4 protein [Candidatus Aminicenantes bacterium]